MSHSRRLAAHLRPTGEFSQLSRLSLKALRRYDELGLLVPTVVDRSSGYRYYGDDQLPRARLISLLRQLEMPLERIGRVLDADPEAKTREIRRYRIELEGEMAVRLRLVDYVERYLQGRGDEMYEIKTRRVPEQQVLTTTRMVRQPELVPFIIEAGSDLVRALDAAGLRHDSHEFVIYDGEVNEESASPVEVCVAFEGSIRPPEGFAIRLEPAHEEAYTTITRAQCRFPEILGAYDAVMTAASENGWEIAASPREVYFVDIDAIGDDDPFVDIAVPIVRNPTGVAAGPRA